MGDKLKSVFQDKPMADQIISSLTYSIPINIGDFEGGFACQIVWSEGSSVDMKTSIECSLDKRNWTEMSNSEITITGNTGIQMYDVTETMVQFIRVKISPVSGSAKFNIHMNGKARV